MTRKKKQKRNFYSSGTQIVSLLIIGILTVLIFQAWSRPGEDVTRRSGPALAGASTMSASRSVVDSNVRREPFISLPNGNYLSGTLDLDLVEEAALRGVKHIYRLNGNGRDRGALSIDEEWELATEYGMVFTYLNIEGREKLAAKTIAAALDRGRVLVHCRNGRHRAPAMVAYWLRRGGMSRSEAAGRVGWGADFLADPGPYARYVDVALKK